MWGVILMRTNRLELLMFRNQLLRLSDSGLFSCLPHLYICSNEIDILWNTKMILKNL